MSSVCDRRSLLWFTAQISVAESRLQDIGPMTQNDTTSCIPEQSCYSMTQYIIPQLAVNWLCFDAFEETIEKILR
jgi:hypothetical protein